MTSIARTLLNADYPLAAYASGLKGRDINVASSAGNFLQPEVIRQIENNQQQKMQSASYAEKVNVELDKYIARSEQSAQNSRRLHPADRKGVNIDLYV